MKTGDGSLRRVALLMLLLFAIPALLYFGVSESPRVPSAELTRPLYTAKLSLQPQELVLQGTLTYYIPNPHTPEIVFNVHHNAYRFGTGGEFYFRAYEDRIFLSGDSSGGVSIGNITVNGAPATHQLHNTTLTVQAGPESKDEKLTIEIPFELTIPQIAHRNGANEHALWLGNWLPILAVLEDGQWVSTSYYPAGDPFYSKVADYDLSITLPEEYTLVATGSREQVLLANGQQTVRITASDVRELAIAVSNQYRKTSRTYEDRVVLSIFSYNVPQELDTRLVDELHQMMVFFERAVGLYPYPELNIVQTSFFLGGMEYPTFIMLGDRTYQTFESARATMLHELGHQWFYGVLGNNEIEEAWFDEGLATFFQNRYTYSQEELDTFYYNEMELLRAQLQVYADVRLGQPLSQYDSWTYYSRVNYRRAALMQYELFSLMGEDKYNTFMRTLYDRNKFGIVDRTGFESLAQEVHGADLTEFFAEWFE